MKKLKLVFNHPEVAEFFTRLPKQFRDPLFKIRELIFKIASSDERIGTVTETLKWNEPAYLTGETGSGSTIRLNCYKGSESDYAIYFNCQTSLVAEFRKIFPNVFRFEKNRAIILSIEKKIPEKEVSHCIRAALLYHANKKLR